jgi:hypothetical protein
VRRWLAFALVLAASPAAGQTMHPPTGTVAQLGTCDLMTVLSGPRLRSVSDGSDASDCTAGGGADVHLCFCDGVSWAAVGGSGEDADTAAGYTFTGLDTSIVTGTLGTSGDCAEWNIDGDLVGSGAACGGGGGIGGSTGAVDNALLLADGAGGALLKSAGADLVFSDALNRLFLQGDSTTPDFHIYKSNAGVGLKRWSVQNVGGASSAVLSFGLLNDTASSWTKQDVMRLRVDSAGSFLDLGTASPATRLRLGSQATAPAACTLGDVYMDSSGAYCVCTSANTWTNTTGVGACT